MYLEGFSKFKLKKATFLQYFEAMFLGFGLTKNSIQL